MRYGRGGEVRRRLRSALRGGRQPAQEDDEGRLGGKPCRPPIDMVAAAKRPSTVTRIGRRDDGPCRKKRSSSPSGVDLDRSAYELSSIASRCVCMVLRL